ncbi:MAG: hypothetical protein ACQETH_16390 [Candidatus Rifleibacteriota bacterium]
MKKYLLGIILMAFAIIALTSGCGGRSPESKKKACFANQRVLLPTVELYNIDHEDTPIKEFKHSMAMKGGILVREKYLPGQIEIFHDKCLYIGTTKDLTKSGLIICDYHGSYENSY